MSYTLLRRFFLTICFVMGLVLIIGACSRQNSQGVALTPTVEPTATCYPVVQATGEKIIYPTVEATPPARLASGQTITVTFSGDYVILNNAIVCGEDGIVGYVYSDELYPDYNWERQVTIQLNEQTLDSISCDYTCRIEVMIPDDTLPGAYQLVLSPPFLDISFDLVVTE